PATLENSPDAEAFLVRTRRTPLDAPLDRIPDTSTSGPPLPFLFGLGASISAVDPDDYDPRRDGLSVRGTSIAAARPALQVAVGPEGSGLLEYSRAVDGTVAVWSLSIDFWRTLDENDALLLESGGSTVIEPASGAIVGAILPAQQSLEVGARLAPLEGTLAAEPADLVASDGARPIALVRAEGPGTVHVVAFGALRPLNVAIDASTGVFAFQANVSGPTVASEHATAQSKAAWLALERGGPLEIPGLRDDFDSLENRLQAAILVR
ncbi:MAG: hypothetical protein AAFZ65_09860, partial [Planctomycetota bacterium]